MKTQYQVEVFGQTFTLVSEKGSEHIQAIASAADSRIREISMQARTITPLRVAIMALLQAEEELREAMRKGFK